jgi:hypothetical protein
MSALEARRQLENALLDIDGFIGVLNKMSMNDEHGVFDKALSYLADQLEKHHRAAEEAFEKMWKACIKRQTKP